MKWVWFGVGMPKIAGNKLTCEVEFPILQCGVKQNLNIKELRKVDAYL